MDMEAEEWGDVGVLCERPGSIDCTVAWPFAERVEPRLGYPMSRCGDIRSLLDGGVSMGYPALVGLVLDARSRAWEVAIWRYEAGDDKVFSRSLATFCEEGDNWPVMAASS